MRSPDLENLETRTPGTEYQETYERYLDSRRIGSKVQYVSNLCRAAEILGKRITPRLLPSPDAVPGVVADMQKGRYENDRFPMVKTALKRYAEMVSDNFEGHFSVSPLSSKGRRLLEAIIAHITANPVDYLNPTTYPSYDVIYGAIAPNAPHPVLYVGHNLRKKGLDDLNEWTMANASLPKITGLIVDKATHRPGNGFFPSYGKTPVTDDGWWHEEVRKAIEFDWVPYGGTQQAMSPIFVADDVDSDEVAPRVKGEISRIVRDTKIARLVKAMYDHTCQLCGNRLELKPGEYYSEAHHLRPLGRPYHGKDKLSNLVCVCPNCHVRLDYHALRIDLSILKVKPGHVIRQKCIDHHNQLCP
jgi:hypothetical protein